MDRKYIENEHIVDRYLSGDLTVREAREFEKYCLEHPDVLNEMPIPVRLKARLARRPLEASETGMFQAIPSSTTHAAVDTADEGFDADEERIESRRSLGNAGVSRLAAGVLVVALLAAMGGAAFFALQASTLQQRIEELQRAATATRMQAPGSRQTYRVQPVRAKPAQPTLSLGWLTPPQLIDLNVDVSEGKYAQFQITIEKVDEGFLMQLKRVARDSNRELRLALNSSAFGPGEYLIRIDGYTWRGQTEEIGWLRLGLK
jgi:hypothetical protein